MTDDTKAPSAFKLVLIPAIITALITAVRCYAEANGLWPELATTEPGKPSPLGISWLIPVFGLYFGWRLNPTRPPRRGGLAMLLFGMGMAVIAGGMFLTIAAVKPPPARVGIIVGVFAVISLGLCFRGWAAMAWTMLLYAVLARLPVVLVTVLDWQMEWNTHYMAVNETVYPGLEPIDRLWVNVGVQATMWLALTTAAGGLFGSLASTLRGKKSIRDAEP